MKSKLNIIVSIIMIILIYIIVGFNLLNIKISNKLFNTINLIIILSVLLFFTILLSIMYLIKIKKLLKKEEDITLDELIEKLNEKFSPASINMLVSNKIDYDRLITSNALFLVSKNIRKIENNIVSGIENSNTYLLKKDELFLYNWFNNPLNNNYNINEYVLIIKNIIKKNKVKPSNIYRIIRGILNFIFIIYLLLCILEKNFTNYNKLILLILFTISTLMYLNTSIIYSKKYIFTDKTNLSKYGIIFEYRIYKLKLFLEEYQSKNFNNLNNLTSWITYYPYAYALNINKLESIYKYNIRY